MTITKNLVYYDPQLIKTTNSLVIEAQRFTRNLYCSKMWCIQKGIAFFECSITIECLNEKVYIFHLTLS
jgi:hypothetical protein